MLAERLGSCWRALVRARLRLPSEFPLRDRSRSQFFVDEGVASGEVDEGESERLASVRLAQTGQAYLAIGYR
jgi:hypothetical protein